MGRGAEQEAGHAGPFPSCNCCLLTTHWPLCLQELRHAAQQPAAMQQLPQAAGGPLQGRAQAAGRRRQVAGAAAAAALAPARRLTCLLLPLQLPRCVAEVSVRSDASAVKSKPKFDFNQYMGGRWRRKGPAGGAARGQQPGCTLAMCSHAALGIPSAGACYTFTHQTANCTCKKQQQTPNSETDPPPPPILAGERAKVIDAALDASVPLQYPEVINEAMRYSLLAGGWWGGRGGCGERWGECRGTLGAADTRGGRGCKLVSWEVELGRPALHSKLEDACASCTCVPAPS